MESNWQASFFRGVALEAWRRVINPETTRAEADFVERTLGVHCAAHILDAPCGNGRHCIELAGRGYQMTGLDQSEEFLAEARQATALPIRWVQDDMRLISWVAEFDGPCCLGNSFCYLACEDARKFLHAVARSLKPGARFILETGMAAESILPSLTPNRWFRLGDILMLSENRYDPTASRLDIDYTFVHEGQIEKRPTTSYVFTAGELCRMHVSAGLHPFELLGSTKGERYQIGSPRLLLISVKQ